MGLVIPEIPGCAICGKQYRSSTPGAPFGLMESFLVPDCSCAIDLKTRREQEETRRPSWVQSLRKLHYPLHVVYRGTRLDSSGWLQAGLREKLKSGTKLFYGGPTDIGKSETLYTLAADALWYGIKVRGGLLAELISDLSDYKKAYTIWDEMREASVLILDGLGTFKFKAVRDLENLYRLVEMFDVPGKSIWIASQVEPQFIFKLKSRIATFDLDEQMVQAINSLYQKLTRNLDCRGVPEKTI